MTPSKFSLLILFTIFTLSLSSNDDDLCNPQDKKVLHRLKSYLGNPSSLVFDSWDPNTDCCSWEDIGCNEHGRVNMLAISEIPDFHGPFPSFLDQLPYLRSLLINHVPNLTGPIPASIGNLTNLVYLYIMETNVSGPIPNLLAQLTKLDILFLQSNGHTGPIPDSLGRIKTLSDINLSFNKLTGPIPSAMAQLTNLVVLDLSSNSLSGPIPDFIGRQLRSLIFIQLMSNQLTGPIPTSLGLMPNLSTLILSNNKLNGPVPTSLGRSKISTLGLSNNKLVGDASFLFEKTNTAVETMDLDNNLLKFDFSNMELGRNLRAFNISHNMIYGSLTKGFGGLMVDSVDVSYNQLCGPIPNGRRFKRVNVNVFAHNKCLCGGPLPACKQDIEKLKTIFYFLNVTFRFCYLYSKVIQEILVR